ncbi:MAG: acetate--CoA ligase family protein [Acetobacteraceae bacterium]|nr:acetate--CoA ligase family protein [Acetobacteraceae bacterium]
MSTHPLESFFWPRSIGILGASPDTRRIRGILLNHLRHTGWDGRIVPINPSYQEIDGLRCFPSLEAVGSTLDVVVIAIPAATVNEAVEDCARNGVKNAIIISSGFAEEGGAASTQQEQLAAIAKRTGIRIAGPNCEGYFNAISRASTTFSPTVEKKEGEAAPLVSPKRIGVAAQSGGIGFSLFNRGAAVGLAYSYVISTGNEADLTVADFIEFMVHDPRTDVVVTFIEAVRDPDRFVRAAAEAQRRGKPIIAIKIGRSEAGRRAAASHTASLSGSHTAYRAVFEKYGLIAADDPDEAMAIAGILLTSPLPRGRRVGVTTASGGGGAWMADVLATAGLQLPTLSPALQGRIREYIPSYGSPQNPVDTTAQGANTGPMQMRTLELLAAADEIDMIVMVTSLASETRVSFDKSRVRPITEAAQKPVSVWTYTVPSALGRRQVAECGIFLHSNLHALAAALGKVVRFAERVRSHDGPPAERATAPALPADLPRVLTEHRVKSLLLGSGLPGGSERLAGSAWAAADAAEALGFPVALKIQSPEIPHKTEAGGVRLNLTSREAVASAYEAIVRAAKAHRPGASIEGVLVQRMAPKGVEMVVGMLNDPTFGPIMMVGFGGTTIEVLGDVAHRPAPVTAAEAAAMVRSLKAAPLLAGFRGAPALDITPLTALIARVSDIATDHRERIADMEFNPVILHADGSGLTIADALVTLR